jgi:hypothetical protein
VELFGEGDGVAHLAQIEIHMSTVTA